MKRIFEKSSLGWVLDVAREILQAMAMALSESSEGSSIGRLALRPCPAGDSFGSHRRKGSDGGRPTPKRVLHRGRRDAERPSSLLPAA